MFACYALRCRIPDVGIIRNALTDVAAVNLIRLEEMDQVISGASLLFVGWEANNPNWDQTAGGFSLTFDSLMERVRQCPAFQNIPILLVTDEESLLDNPSLNASGFTGILTRPLERETIRQQTAEALGEVGRRTILGPSIKPGLAAYTVKCLPTDRVVIQNALGLQTRVIEVDPEALETAQPAPEIVFLRWGAAYPESKYSPEERQMVTGMLLGRIFGALAFRDIPVILLADRGEQNRTTLSTRFGCSAIVTLPLDKKELREVTANVLRPVGKDTRIDVRIVNPFVEATCHVLKKMAGIEVTSREVLLKKDYRLFGEVSALIGISGEAIEGAVGITFHESLAKKVVQHMIGEQVEEMNQHLVNDVLGELINVVCGRATSQLTREKDLEFSLSVPSIITGVGHQITHLSDVPCLAIVFETEDKPFAVQVAIRFN